MFGLRLDRTREGETGGRAGLSFLTLAFLPIDEKKPPPDLPPGKAKKLRAGVVTRVDERSEAREDCD